MNHFNPILNKYNAVKKKLKAKVSERKELNVQKDKTSILNPIQHIKLNQQLTTVTEEIEELKSRKEQLIFQADVFSHRAWKLKYQRKLEIRRNQPARTKKKSYDIEL